MDPLLPHHDVALAHRILVALSPLVLLPFYHLTLFDVRQQAMFFLLLLSHL